MVNVDELFRARDKAVRECSSTAFSETQFTELLQPSVSSYLELKLLETTVLADVDEQPDLTKVVLVKETYTEQNGQQRSTFVMYGLVNTVRGWRIHTANYAFPRMGPWRR